MNLSTEIAIIFASKELNDVIENVDFCESDATFYVCPQHFYQFFTIMVSYKNHAFPAFFALMTKKTEKLYSSILNEIKVHFPNFNPSVSMSDFERAIMSSFEQTFPGIILHGCVFHYKQGVYKKVKKYCLSRVFHGNAIFDIMFTV